MTATYQIYALKYGERETKEGQFFFREASQKPLTLHFFIWVILGGPHPIVVDTGCTEPDAKLKELRAFVSPADMLARVGVKATEVPVTLVSHLHWDHWGGYPYFPGSTFWMQREELEFWTGIAGQHENYRSFALPESLAQLVRLNYSGRVKLVSGEAAVAPGIMVHWIGGHTAGLQGRLGAHGQGPGGAHLGRLALLPQHRAARSRADHHQPAPDARGLRHHRRARGGQGARGGWP